MSNIRTSKKWLAIVAKDDGTAEKLIMAMDEHRDKFSSTKGLEVIVNGYRYIIKDAPTKPPKM